MGCVPAHRSRPHAGLAFGRRQEAGEDAHGSGFPGPIGTEETGNLPFFDAELWRNEAEELGVVRGWGLVGRVWDGAGRPEAC